MPNVLTPYLDLAKDAAIALTDPNYAYSLLVAAAPLLTVVSVVVLIGRIATHGKLHGTRFSAMAVFVLEAIAGISAYLLRPDAAADTMLAWSWTPPLVAGLALFATILNKPKPRAVGLIAALLIALFATLYGGMLSIANQRALHPDKTTWSDAPPTPVTDDKAVVEEEPVKLRPVLDTAATR